MNPFVVSKSFSAFDAITTKTKKALRPICLHLPFLVL